MLIAPSFLCMVSELKALLVSFECRITCIVYDLTAFYLVYSTCNCLLIHPCILVCSVLKDVWHVSMEVIRLLISSITADRRPNRVQLHEKLFYSLQMLKHFCNAEGTGIPYPELEDDSIYQVCSDYIPIFLILINITKPGHDTMLELAYSFCVSCVG